MIQTSVRLLHAKDRESKRQVEPHGVVYVHPRGYLAAWARVRDDWRRMAEHIALFGVDFEVQEPPELVTHSRLLQRRLGRAVARSK